MLPAELTLDEKALIYCYTDEGSKALNRALKRYASAATLPFAQDLAAALAKLPAYRGEAFHGADFSEDELAYYQACWRAGIEVVWQTFVSATMDQAIAERYAENVLLALYSRSGRELEELSAHGKHTPRFLNEHEVVFSPGARFLVEDISQEGDLTVITLLEQ